MKIVITGSNGFIGSHLVKRMELNKHEVYGLPRQFLSNPLATNVLFKGWTPDFIIHCAAYGNMHDQDNDTDTLNANVAGLCDLLQATNDIPFKGFINFSSSSVALPYETMYSASKAAGERIVKAWINKYDKPIVNVRPYSVYGPGEADFRFIPTVIKKALNNEAIELDPEPMHDWIYIDDLVDAIEVVMDNMDSLKGKTIDIGTGLSEKNKWIVNKLYNIMPEEFKVKKVKGLRPYDTQDWVANTKVLNDLGWKPKHDIIDGLKKTYEYYK